MLRDPEGSGNTWTSTQLDLITKTGLRDLYRRGLGQETSNYSGTYTDMSLALSTTTDYALPTGWKRVLGVEFWESNTNPLPVAKAGIWSTRMRSGYIRIYDAPSMAGYRIHLTGLKGWTGVDDSSMPEEVYQALLLGTVYFALKGLANRRAQNRRSNTSVDVSLGQQALYLRQALKEYLDA